MQGSVRGIAVSFVLVDIEIRPRSNREVLAR
jgi:hypothetical protein